MAKAPRFQFEVQLPSNQSKARFSAIIEEAKRLMTPPGQRKLDNYRFVMSLIDVAKQHFQPSSERQESVTLPIPRQLSWMESSGELLYFSKYIYIIINVCMYM